MRLIDADALFIAVDVGDTDVWQVDADGWGTGGYSTDTMKSMIEKAPTIDAVPVVRCEDCTHRADPMECPMCYEEYTDLSEDEWDSRIFDFAVYGGFCSYGERKDGDTDAQS